MMSSKAGLDLKSSTADILTMTHFLSRTLSGLLVAVSLLLAAGPAGAFSRDIVVIRTSGNSYRFNVELAVSEGERAEGLMFRKEMAPNAGMLFLYNQDQAVTFWMKNTYLPLDMIFIASDGRITQVVKRAQPLSEDLIPSSTYIRAVLEVNAGITDQYDIQPGDHVDYGAFKMPGAASSKTPGQ
jgi:uncharacterized membrane protein (UPF0127 family)